MNALEAALETIRNADSDPLVAAKCIGLMRGYDHRWKQSGWVATAVEADFEIPIVNPHTGRRSRNFTQAGKYDGIATYNRQPWLIEHKTTSHDISDPNATYFRQLAIDSQVSSYMLAHWQGGVKLAGTLYDVIRKPGISPKRLTKAERASVVANGRYFDTPVSSDDRKRLACDERESFDMYSARLAADTIERSTWYFQRRTVPRLDNEIVEYADELWDVAQAVTHARKNGSHYRNSGACILYNSPCEFLGICSGHDSPDSDNWVSRKSMHSELNLDRDPSTVLTHSRVRCFQTCRRKHYYRYELGIERRDEEQKEALFFGSLFHEALAAWWSTFLEKSNDDCNGHSISGIEQASNVSQAIVAR